MQRHVEELQQKVARYFEDQNDAEGEENPNVKPPSQPTAEEWERHQTTHTPYAAWCPYCNAARAVRRDHSPIEHANDTVCLVCWGTLATTMDILALLGIQQGKKGLVMPWLLW